MLKLNPTPEELDASFVKLMTRKRLKEEIRFHQTELKDRFGRPYCGCARFIKEEADSCEHLDLLQEIAAAEQAPLIS